MNNKVMKVEGEPTLYRDATSGGILSNDAAYNRYREQKAKIAQEMAQRNKINILEHRIESIEEKLHEILLILRGK